MVKTLVREHVEQYIRDSMEPVPYTKLVDEFTYPSARGEKRNNVKDQLENILNIAIDSGSIIQYKDHFYSSYLPEDLEGVVQCMEEEDMPSVLSQISFSSCESIDSLMPDDSEDEQSSESFEEPIIYHLRKHRYL